MSILSGCKLRFLLAKVQVADFVYPNYDIVGDKPGAFLVSPTCGTELI